MRERTSVIKAVIAVAGTGTRFFPVTKTLNKSMLPILERPVVDHAVADCLAAGATEIALVVAPGPSGDQVRHFYGHDAELEAFFARRGWADKYAPIAGVHTRARFTFIEQPRDDDRYGTALPAVLAAEWIGDDDFLLVAGDDLLLRADGGSDLADLAAARAAGAAGVGADAALAAVEVPGADAGRYGVLRPRPGTRLLDRLDEKPRSFDEATARVHISRSLLPASALPYFLATAPSPTTGEYQATDALNAFARDHAVLLHTVAGRYFDCGNTSGWLAANNAAAALAATAAAR